MLYLINPRKRSRNVARKRRTKKRTPPRGPGGLFMKRKKRKATGTVKRRTTRKATKRRTIKRRKPTVARKRSTTRRRRTTKRRRTGGTIRLSPVRGKIYRKNPAFSMRGAIRDLQNGAMNAGMVIIGKTGARVVANFLPLPKEGIMNYVTQIVAALATGMVARQFVGAKQAEFIVAGALSAPVETLLKGVPVIGGFLSDDALMMGEYLAAGGMGEYQLPVGEYDLPVGEYPMGEYVQY
jgi:hypothetical protein